MLSFGLSAVVESGGTLGLAGMVETAFLSQERWQTDNAGG